MTGASGEGPVVLVAGGTGTLARAPRRLAAAGARFALIGPNEASARAAEEAFSRAGAEAIGVAVDLLKDGAFVEATDRARERFGADPDAVVWNVGFVPRPAPQDWDPSVLGRVARDEARALGGMAQALVPIWSERPEDDPPPAIVTIEGHREERITGGVPAIAVAMGVRMAVVARMRCEVPGLRLVRVVLGAVPSGPVGEGRWLTQDEIAGAVGDALARRPDRVVVGDLALAEKLAERYRS